jgi:F0F1-type ATP synthase membrane subunit b/b'
MAEFEVKVRAQLKTSKSLMKQIETLAKGMAAQAEIDAINSLKSKRQEVEKNVQDLKTSADTKAKAAVETSLAKFNDSLRQVVTKLKSQAASKSATSRQQK